MKKWKILINDGMHAEGMERLRQEGFEVVEGPLSSEELRQRLDEFDVVVVRSATKLRKELLSEAQRLKLIVRGGVGLDNIDVAYAQSKGIEVRNTPAASSRSVAELVIGHMLSLARFIHLSNREMPQVGDVEFKSLKKKYSKGIELAGKKLGIVGCGRIGKALAVLALGMGMEVIPVDVFDTLEIDIYIAERMIPLDIPVVSLDEMLPQADFISIHVPAQSKPLIDRVAFEKMKRGVILINAARGGVVDEDALLEALDAGIVRAAGLDVFEGEPHPKKALLQHPQVSVTPHIGASTIEAQKRIAHEVVDIILDAYQRSTEAQSS